MMPLLHPTELQTQLIPFQSSLHSKIQSREALVPRLLLSLSVNSMSHWVFCEMLFNLPLFGVSSWCAQNCWFWVRIQQKRRTPQSYLYRKYVNWKRLPGLSKVKWPLLCPTLCMGTVSRSSPHTREEGELQLWGPPWGCGFCGHCKGANTWRDDSDATQVFLLQALLVFTSVCGFLPEAALTTVLLLVWCVCRCGGLLTSVPFLAVRAHWLGWAGWPGNSRVLLGLILQSWISGTVIGFSMVLEIRTRVHMAVQQALYRLSRLPRPATLESVRKDRPFSIHYHMVKTIFSHAPDVGWGFLYMAIRVSFINTKWQWCHKWRCRNYKTTKGDSILLYSAAYTG